MNRQEIERLKNDLRAIGNDVGQLLEDATAQAGQMGDETKSRLHDVHARLQDAEARAAERIGEAGFNANRYIHAKLWAAIGTAAAVAFLLDALVRRKY